MKEQAKPKAYFLNKKHIFPKTLIFRLQLISFVLCTPCINCVTLHTQYSIVMHTHTCTHLGKKPTSYPETKIGGKLDVSCKGSGINCGQCAL